MARKRIEMMEKARAKRSRRAASRRRKQGGAETDAAGDAGLPEKVIELTQEAIGQIESLVKTTSKKIKEAAGPPPPSRLSKGS